MPAGRFATNGRMGACGAVHDRHVFTGAQALVAANNYIMTNLSKPSSAPAPGAPGRASPQLVASPFAAAAAAMQCSEAAKAEALAKRADGAASGLRTARSAVEIVGQSAHPRSQVAQEREAASMARDEDIASAQPAASARAGAAHPANAAEVRPDPCSADHCVLLLK